MNSKTAKVFRRAARAATKGEMPCVYLRTRRGGLVIAPLTTRGAYRAMKKMMG